MNHNTEVVPATSKMVEQTMSDVEAMLEEHAQRIFALATEQIHLSWRDIAFSTLGLQHLPRDIDHNGMRHHLGTYTQRAVRRYCFQNAQPYPYRHGRKP